MAEGLQLFTTFLLVQIFYALAVTMIVPTLPGMAGNQVVADFQNGTMINVTTLSESMQSGVSEQSSIPLLEFGAMIFYSSNIIVSLMLNFFTAIPQMLTVLISGFFTIFPLIPGAMKEEFMIIVQALLTIIYMIAVLTFIMGARSALKVA